MNKFLVLMKKELRETLLCSAGGMVVLAAIDYIIIRIHIQHSLFDRQTNIYDLFRLYPLEGMGPWLLIISLIMGAALGFVQFGLPSISGIWPFLLHRSVSRRRILGSKLLMALIWIMGGLGLIWTVIYIYGNRIIVTPWPVHHRVLLEGWLLIGMGYVFYLSMVLVALGTARWYTTRLFPLALAVLIMAAVMVQWRPVYAVLVWICGMLILLVQILDTFLNREF